MFYYMNYLKKKKKYAERKDVVESIKDLLMLLLLNF